MLMFRDSQDCEHNYNVLSCETYCTGDCKAAKLCAVQANMTASYTALSAGRYV